MSPAPSIDPNNFDISIKPTDDFFGFVNGGWLKKNPIPKEESRWGAFTVLRVEVEKQLKAILDELVAGPEAQKGSISRKVRDFYLTAMDREMANRLGTAPLDALFAMIDNMHDARDIARVIGRLHRSGVSVGWTPYVAQDEKNTEVMAFHPYQGGLGLPDRDYYLKDDEKSREIREKYLRYMKEMFPHASLDPALAETVMHFEKELAKASRTRVELRDPEKQYNKFLFSEMERLTPSIDWKPYFEDLSFAAPEYFIVGQPEFMESLDRFVKEGSFEVLKAYLRWHTTNSMAMFLTEEMERLHFDFYGRTFGGATEMKPRWRRALTALNSALDDAVAQLYVERHFSAEAKRKVNELVDCLVAAYRERIKALDWMSAETKEKALQKLSAVSRKLGYPDKWKDIDALAVGTTSYAENYMSAHAFEFDRQMRKIGEPVDRTEWVMSPQTVNACYEPTMNEILFPAAILQPPFFDPDADDAVNFGGIGTVIGHELTHGFDDEGSKFDAKGNLINWWTPEDRKRFDKKTDHLAAQFDRYEPLPGASINGQLTLGENIADLGGLLIAYDGLQLLLKERGGMDAALDNFTPNQRFFISHAITWREHQREEYLRLSLRVNPHSPDKYRVIGPMSNLEEFYAAFGCKSGDKLFREPRDRVKIW